MHTSYFCAALVVIISYADSITVHSGALTCTSITSTLYRALEKCTYMCKTIHASIVSQAKL